MCWSLDGVRVGARTGVNSRVTAGVGLDLIFNWAEVRPEIRSGARIGVRVEVRDEVGLDLG